MKRPLSHGDRIELSNAAAVVVVPGLFQWWQLELTRAVAAVGSRTALQDGGAVILCGRSFAAVAAGWMGGGTCG